MKIKWRYVAALMSGMLFLIFLSKAFCCFSQMDRQKEDFLFIYEDVEKAEKLSAESDGYGIISEVISGAVVAVKESELFDCRKVRNYFQEEDGKIEAELFRWLQHLFLVIFTAGIVFILWKEGHGGGISSGISVAVWIIFLKDVPGTFRIPVWALPGKWSDFEGWKRMWNSVGEQLFSMLRYRDIPVIYEYCHAVYGTFVFLLLSFMLLMLYRKCCRNLKHEYFVHGIMAFAAIILYIKGMNPDMKALLSFFPCYMSAKYDLVWLTVCPLMGGEMSRRD